MATANLGTAWIQVKPSMSGVRNSILSSLTGTGTQFSNQMGGELGRSRGLSAGMAAMWGAATAVAYKAINALSNSFQDGVARFDTLKNYPIIMQNLGYSTDESRKSMDKLKNAVLGLPTGLDQIASSAKSLAPFTKSLDQATDLSIALNDAFLANGSSQADVSRGLIQYTQMLSKGKVDLMAWRTLQETMGSSLQQTAKKLGFATGNTNELYDALQSGKISFDDFSQAIIDLDKTGLDGFKSLRDQAFDATGGIQTAMDNLGAAMARFWASIFSAIGSDKIAAAFKIMGDAADAAGKAIGEAIIFATPYVEKFISYMSEKFKEIQPALKEFGDTFVNDILPVLIDFGKFAIDVLTKVVDFIAKNFKAVAITVGILAGAFIALKAALAIGSVITTIKGIAGALLGLSTASTAASGSITKGLPAAFKAVGTAIGNFLKALGKAAMGPQLWVGLLAGIAIIGAVRIAFELLKPVLDWLVAKFIEIVTKILPPFTTFAQQVLIPVIGMVLQAIVQLVGIIASALVPIFQTVANTVVRLAGLFNQLVSIIGGTVIGIINALGNAFEKVGNTVANIVNSIGSAISRVVSSIAGGISQVIGSVAGGISQIIDSITRLVNAINNVDLYKLGRGIGGDFVRGLIDGIGDLIGSIVNKVKSLANNIIDTVKKILGIASPSKEGKKLGRWFDMGIAGGIDKHSKDVTRAAGKMTEKMLSKASDFSTAFNAGFTPNGALVGAVAGAGGVGGQTNFYVTNPSPEETAAIIASRMKTQGGL